MSPGGAPQTLELNRESQVDKASPLIATQATHKSTKTKSRETGLESFPEDRLSNNNERSTRFFRKWHDGCFSNAIFQLRFKTA